jgi:hypothetical protein
MNMRTIWLLATIAALGYAQTTAHARQEQKPTIGLYQRQPGAHLYQQRDDFFHASTKLVNPKDIDYGAMLEQRRKAFLEASVTNPFFWYSALTTAFLLVLMLAYGVRVMDEKRKLWRAAEILTDVWNDGEYARATAHSAIEKFNGHMQECNRVIEAQVSGRPSPAAVEAEDARKELTRVRSELDKSDSERKAMKAKLEEKEKVVDDLSARVRNLETSGGNGNSSPGNRHNGGEPRDEAERRLIARINQLTQQLEAEKQKNRALKGA